MPKEVKALTLADLSGFKKIKKVDIPELKGAAYVRSFTAQKRLELIEEHFDMNGGQSVPKDGKQLQLQYAVVRLCLCDASGNLIAENDEGLELLKQMSAEMLDTICNAAMELNGLAGQELIEKNLPSQGDVSPIN
jgi:hypothetical protein